MECPAPTSLPTSLPVVDTLLSKADGQLTSTQTEYLTALLDEFGDVFSDVPGRTTLGVQNIALKPDTKRIRSAPYRLNQQKAKVRMSSIIFSTKALLRRALVFGLRHCNGPEDRWVLALVCRFQQGQ